MSLRYTVLSLIALCIIFLLILRNYETWTRSFEATPERSTAKKQEATGANPSALGSQKVAGSAQPYVAIAGKNMFSPERRDFPVQSSDTRKLVRPQIILYGVTLVEGTQFASISNPGRPLLRGERETMSLKIGDKIGGYRLAKITSDHITLEAEGDTFEVLLYDPTMPKKRIDVKTETKPATITSSQASPQGGASTTGPTPTPTPSGAPKPSAPIPQVAPPRVIVPSTPSTSPVPYNVRRGRSPVGYPSPVVPPAGSSTGSTPPATGQPQGTGGN